MVTEFSTSPPPADETDWNSLLDHGLEKPCNYLIRQKGADWEAINGSTGKVDYGGDTDVGGVDGASLIAVCTACDTALATNGGYVFVKGAEKPAFTISAKVVFVFQYENKRLVYTSSGTSGYNVVYVSGSIASGGTIAHGVGKTPKYVWAHPNVNYPIMVGWTFDDTNISIYHDGLGAVEFNCKVEHD